MTKLRNKRKARLPLEAQLKKTKASSITTPPPELREFKTIQSLGLEGDDLEIVVDTLRTLSENPSVIKSKACRELRNAVYNFRQASTTGLNTTVDSNIASRISGALADGRYTDARILLAEMRIREFTPKLGSLCRWVRDLDVVSGLAEQLQVCGMRRTPREEELLRTLDSILRLTGQTDYSPLESPLRSGPIIPRGAWNLRDSGQIKQVYDSVVDGSIFRFAPSDMKSDFRIIENTPGSQRKPPNLHPAILYASRDDAITLSITPPTSTHHKHPVVPNLHLLKDVLRQEECLRIIAAAESIGFTPDAPVRAADEEASVLAHNFYWIVDNVFNAKLWQRVQQYVPKEIGKKKVRGLNRRFRLYRYIPGAEYRVHIDGAWPPSGIGQDDSYIYDTSPSDAKQSSLLTFLIYLNDEFDAGETTFFLPSMTEGSLNAYPVKPVQGSVVMFPHGETDGSLLHEGTGVSRGEKPSAKYVIRTDVLYDVNTQ